MNKGLEGVIMLVMGAGPVIMFMVLTEGYGWYGQVSAMVTCGLYFIFFIVTFSVRKCCYKAKQVVHQVEDPSDLPPSYEDVTSKPPPYCLLFASRETPSAGNRNNGSEYVTVPSLTLPRPVPWDLSTPPSYAEVMPGGAAAIPWSSSLVNKEKRGKESEALSCTTIFLRLNIEDTASSSLCSPLTSTEGLHSGPSSSSSLSPLTYTEVIHNSSSLSSLSPLTCTEDLPCPSSTHSESQSSGFIGRFLRWPSNHDSKLSTVSPSRAFSRSQSSPATSLHTGSSILTGPSPTPCTTPLPSPVPLLNLASLPTLRSLPHHHSYDTLPLLPT